MIHRYAGNPGSGKGSRRSMTTFTDANIKEDRIISPGYIAGDDWCYLEGSGPWDWEGVDEPVIRRRCPVCGSLPLRRREYCARCDRAGLDGRVTYPGLAVDSAPDPTYPAQGTKYQPSGKLRGGR
jgi:hypothetical protein